MSELPENELDLEKLFLPAWAQEPSSAKHYAQYEGGEERPERRGGRKGFGPGRREGGPGGQRPRGDRPRDDRRGPRPAGLQARREGGGGFNRERPPFRR